MTDDAVADQASGPTGGRIPSIARAIVLDDGRVVPVAVLDGVIPPGARAIVLRNGHRVDLSDPLRDNVLAGVTRREGLPPGVPPPFRPPRLVNLTIRVDDLSLNYARGRAVVEGTSISALVNQLLEEYSGIARPPGQEISRRIPMFRERQIRAIEGVDDL